MSRRLSPLLLLIFAAPVFAQAPAVGYKIDFDPARDVTLLDKNAAGTAGLFVKVKFEIAVDAAAAADPTAQFKILIEENGRKVHEANVPRPTPTEDLAVVLAMDTSLSMKEQSRMDRARQAAQFFVNRLPPRCECGLVLFDHEIRKELAPSTVRGPVLKAVAEAMPRGGTAFRDAAARGVELLAKSSSKQKYLVLMTDGVDLHSTQTLEHVGRLAKQNHVKIITVGIGEPGKHDPVNTILVLDCSTSMDEPANNTERVTKIEALRFAAKRFIEIMPPNGSASILPFNQEVSPPSEFTSDHRSLLRRIASLKLDQGTFLHDATDRALDEFARLRRPGKRAIVVMTDGLDNTSRLSGHEVVQKARKSNIPIYTLGFGREDEVDWKFLRPLSEGTNGQTFHALNKASLVNIFEELSIRLHDDGIDESALKHLASASLGEYYAAKDIAKLKLAFEYVTEAIQRTPYEITFPSLIQKRDGTNRLVAIKLVRRSGESGANLAGGSSSSGDQVLESTGSSYQTRGLVVAEMHPLVYLFLLTGLTGLLAAPALLRKKTERTASR